MHGGWTGASLHLPDPIPTSLFAPLTNFLTEFPGHVWCRHATPPPIPRHAPPLSCVNHLEHSLHKCTRNRHRRSLCLTVNGDLHVRVHAGGGWGEGHVKRDVATNHSLPLSLSPLGINACCLSLLAWGTGSAGGLRIPEWWGSKHANIVMNDSGPWIKFDECAARTGEHIVGVGGGTAE